MLRLHCLVLVGATALVGMSALAAPPRGKVVRVERKRLTAAAVPSLCEVQSSLQGLCVGAPPKPGDLVLVVTEGETIAEVRIKTVRAATPKCDSVWTIDSELVRGDISQATRRRSIGVIDPALDRRTTRKVDESNIEVPGNEPDLRVALGIDRDGDDVADVVLTQSKCSGTQPSAEGECLDIWTSTDTARPMKRVWSANIQPCF